MSVINFQEYKARLEKPNYTSEPKPGRNLYKKNLIEKRIFFDKNMGDYINNPYIEKCKFSLNECIVKFSSRDLQTDFLLILQDYSPEEFDSNFATWEFCIYNTSNEEYIDSRFFTSSEMAIKYFISKIKYSI